jgi:hypothetical protein
VYFIYFFIFFYKSWYCCQIVGEDRPEYADEVNGEETNGEHDDDGDEHLRGFPPRSQLHAFARLPRRVVQTYGASPVPFRRLVLSRWSVVSIAPRHTVYYLTCSCFIEKSIKIMTTKIWSWTIIQHINLQMASLCQRRSKLRHGNILNG